MAPSRPTALAPAPPPLHGGLNEDRGRRHGAVGAALLLGVLFIVVLGVFGAIYFDDFPGISYGPGPHAETTAPTAPLAQTTPIPPPAIESPQAPAANPNFAAAPVPPAMPPAPPMHAPLPPSPSPQVEVTPAIAAPQAAQTLAPINPAAGRETPPGLAARPGYWVEYGAFRGVPAAERMKKLLSDQQITAQVTRTTGDDGVYYRVRSAGNADRDRAAAALAKAQTALNIDPLLHREGEAKAEAVYTPPPSPQEAAAPVKYWVQFGAYNIESYAKKLVVTLQHDGIAAELVTRPGAARRPFYFVRSPLLNDRNAAQRLAERGQTLLVSDTLLGQTLPVPAAGARRL